MDYEKRNESMLGSRMDSNKSKIWQESYPVHTDNSLKALKESSSLQEVIDKMIKFREDIESRMN